MTEATTTLTRAAGQGSVDLGETMRAAAGIFLPESKKEIDAGRMMFVIRVKRGDEHRGIKKGLHLLPPAF